MRTGELNETEPTTGSDERDLEPSVDPVSASPESEEAGAEVGDAFEAEEEAAPETETETESVIPEAEVVAPEAEVVAPEAEVVEPDPEPVEQPSRTRQLVR